MKLKELEQKFHEKIPMIKLMGVKLDSIDENNLITSIPIDININDKGTAFGGSTNSLAIISGWFMCTIVAERLGFEKNEIAIIKNESSFKAPITKNLICYTKVPNNEELENIKNKLLEKGSSSVKLHSIMNEDNKLCFEFSGVYVIKLKK